ncbi:MAG: hypothetical protein HYV26_04215 [Candidatus Hydrogenedentes bacterium]|nr:hypothetical protein [Candidatus Hydrogenedentota bacterium]
MSTRRRFLQQAVALAGAGTFAVNLKSRAATPGAARRFHLSVSIDALNADPELLDIVRGAGVSDLWLACFFQGQWHHTIEEYVAWRDRIAAAGMETHQITIPLGHLRKKMSRPFGKSRRASPGLFLLMTISGWPLRPRTLAAASATRTAMPSRASTATHRPSGMNYWMR